MAGLRRASLAGLIAAALAGCGGTGSSSYGDQSTQYSGTCQMLHSDPGQLVFAPSPGNSGPAFRLTAVRGEGDYDAQVNAVDAQGRYGPDARGTVHLDAQQQSGTLTTPDLRLASGDTTRYAGRWRCASTVSASAPPERPGGPQSPR